MVDAPIVAVRGEVIRDVPPEIARFMVTVAARDRNRQQTLSRLSGRSEAVRELIDGYGEAIEKRETGALQVFPELKRSGEKVSAYRGSVSTTVTVVDFTVLGELMLRLADHDQTSVHGPWWELRPNSPVYGEARRAAITDAVARAREYAEAVGARLVGLLEIADIGLTHRPLTRMETVAATSMAAMASAAEEPELDLDPRQQTVTAGVEVRFAISEPTVLDGAAE